MDKLKQMIQVLEQAEIKERTLQELISDGFSLEQIDEALQEGYLQRGEENEVYVVTSVALLKKNRKVLRHFYSALFSRDYSAAYQHIKTYFEIVPKEQYDIRNYFVTLLLKELLPSEYDFSFLENISIFSSSKGQRFQDHFKLYTSILCGDFLCTAKYLSEIEAQERDNKGTISVFTQALRVILDGVLLHETNVLKDISSEEKDEKYQEHFKKFLMACEQMQAKDALDALKQMTFYDRKENKSVYLNAQNFLIEVLQFMEDDEILLNNTDHFVYFDQDPKLRFEKALLNHDYQNAYINVKKCLSINPDDPWFLFYNKWLQRLLQLNKKHVRLIEETKRMSRISSSELSDSIYHREYQQLLESFRSGKASRYQSKMHNLVYQMLGYLEKIYNNIPIFRENHVYVCEKSQLPARFYEAVHCQDYEEAFRLFPDCMQIISESGLDTQEFSTYGYILEDIVFEKCKDRVSDFLRQILSKKISTFSISRLQYLQGLFERKLECSSALLESEYDFYVTSVLDMLLLVKENKLGLCLNQCEYEEADPLSMWKMAMDVGDYLSALSIMEREDFKEQMEHSIYKRYFVFIEQLLMDMKKTMIENDQFVPIAKPLGNVRQFVENNDFIGAYTYYKNTDMGDVSSELEIALCALLPVLNQFQQRELRSLLTQYQVSLKIGDMEKAEQCILRYKELIKNTSFDKNLDYYLATIQSERIERSSPNYEEKEELYKKALRLFQKKQYQNAIVVLNEYIKKDFNMSAKGYFLRGRINEYLKQYGRAIRDYSLALLIIPDPIIYYRLGQIYYYQKQYPLAFNSFLASDERDPITSERDLIKMVELSDALKKTEYKQIYEEKVKRLGSIANK